MSVQKTKVIQLCHSADAPFAEVAENYARLFDPERYELLTIFLKHSSNQPERLGGHPAEHWNLGESGLKGLKLGLIIKLVKKISAFKPSVVMAQRFKPTYLALQARRFCPNFDVIGVSHAYDVFRRKHRKKLALKHQKHLHLIGVSDAIRQNLVDQLPGFPHTNIHALANCTDNAPLTEQLLSKEEARKLLGLEQDALVIGSLGRLHPDKDPQTLIKAFAELNHPQAKLVIMGKGRLEAELKALIDSLGLSERVLLKGFVPNGARLLKAFDVFALASALEPFGMVFTEAICAGIPVIASASGGAQQVIHRSDLLFPIGDVNAASERLEQALNWNDSEREAIVEWLTQRYLEHFTHNAFFANFWQLPIAALNQPT